MKMPQESALQSFEKCATHRDDREVAMFDSNSVYDGRVRYPGRIMASVPLGVREAAHEAAVAQGVSVAEFARRAIIRALTERRDNERQSGGVPRKLDGAA
jgi:predicted HicB family RNase H-like nuclease